MEDMEQTRKTLMSSLSTSASEPTSQVSLGRTRSWKEERDSSGVATYLMPPRSSASSLAMKKSSNAENSTVALWIR
jgi:hypothetical protein